MTYHARPYGQTIEGMRIGRYGRELLARLGCTVEHYIDADDTSDITPQGTNAWRVQLPRGVRVQEPTQRTTASGHRRRGQGPTLARRLFRATWLAWDGDYPIEVRCCWFPAATLDRLTRLPATFTEIETNGELVAGSRLAH